MYWAQGIDQAPPVVQLCQEKLRSLHSPEELVVLDEGSLEEYAEIPGIVRDRLVKNPTNSRTFFASSRLRPSWGRLARRHVLSARAGARPSARALALGILRVSLSAGAHLELDAGWRAEQSCARAHAGGAARLLGALPARDRLLRRTTFEALYYLVDEFRELVVDSPWRSSHPPARFARRMLEPYDAALYTRLLEGSFIHKLSYKYQPERRRRTRSSATLMRGEEPA